MSRNPQLARAIYLATGSSIERLIRCASSIGLTHLYFETVHTERGTIIHKYLEMCADGDREAALAAVPEMWRDACEAIDLTGLDVQLALTAEIAMAYDAVTDETRELGRGAGRLYDDVRDSEIPCMLDVVGVRVIDGRRIGLVVDWKTGWLTRKKKVASDWQLKFGALAAARLFDLDEVEVQLINLSEGKPYVQRATYTRFQIGRIAAEIRGFYTNAVEVRALHAAGRLPEKFNVGEWCEMCPAKSFCPAQRSLVAAALGEEFGNVNELTDEQLGELYVRALRVRKRAGAVVEQIKQIANASGRRRPILLARENDGKFRYLASVIKEGNEVVDGPVTRRVVGKILGDKYADIAAPPDASKKAIGLAVRAAAKDGVIVRGQGAKTTEKILAAIRKEKNGAKRKAAAPHIEELIVDAPLVGSAPLELAGGDS